MKLISIFGFIPFFSSVQTPFGPRKSGIPHAVEIPAPVWTTMCLDLRIRSTSFSTFSVTSDGVSKIWRESGEKSTVNLIEYLKIGCYNSGDH